MRIKGDFKKNLEKFYENDPFIRFLDFRIACIQKEQVDLEVHLKKEYANALNIVHGGLLMTLADTAMGAACMSCNKKVVTLDINFNFIKAVAINGAIVAKARVLHDGRRTMVTEAEILDKNNSLCAKARGTFFVVEKFML